MYAFTRRLNHFVPLGRRETEWIDELQSRHDTFAAGETLPPHMVASRQTRVVVSGWLLRTRILSGGSRRLHGIYLPGDILHLSGYENTLQSATECLTQAQLANVDSLYKFAAEQSATDRVIGALSSVDRFDYSVMLNTIERLSRQSAYDRVLHFLLEMRLRLSVVGLANENSFNMPLTQQDLGDALNMSFVHVNRIIKQLKNDGVIRRDKRTISISNPDALAEEIDFYLPFPSDRSRDGPQSDASRRSNPYGPNLAPYRASYGPRAMCG